MTKFVQPAARGEGSRRAAFLAKVDSVEPRCVICRSKRPSVIRAHELAGLASWLATFAVVYPRARLAALAAVRHRLLSRVSDLDLLARVPLLVRTEVTATADVIECRIELDIRQPATPGETVPGTCRATGNSNLSAY
jgi:hypothetical protein